MKVSIFSSTAPAKDRSAIYQHGYKAISNVLLPTRECTLKAFLKLGLQQLGQQCCTNWKLPQTL